MTFYLEWSVLTLLPRHAAGGGGLGDQKRPFPLFLQKRIYQWKLAQFNKLNVFLSLTAQHRLVQCFLFFCVLVCTVVVYVLSPDFVVWKYFILSFGLYPHMFHGLTLKKLSKSKMRKLLNKICWKSLYVAGSNKVPHTYLCTKVDSKAGLALEGRRA